MMKSPKFKYGSFPVSRVLIRALLPTVMRVGRTVVSGDSPAVSVMRSTLERRVIAPLVRKAVKFLPGLRTPKCYSDEATYHYLQHCLKKAKPVTEVLGHKMFLREGYDLGLPIWGIFEPVETELVKKVIKRGNVVLDIGANIGYYTLIAAKVVGETGKVFAFEPYPTTFSILEKNVKVNGYNNVILVQKAISNKTGKLKLHLWDSASHSICDSHGSHQSIIIEGIRLDDYFENYDGNIDFIKMDIEGAENWAIQGMPSLLAKNKNVKIMTEFNPPKLTRAGVEPEEYLGLLTERGFKLYYINMC